MNAPSPAPLRILVAGDFGGAAGPRPVTRETLDEACALVAPRIEINISDLLALAKEGRDLELGFGSLDDFDPSAIVARLSALDATATLRGQLAGLESDGEVEERLDALLEPVEKIGLKRALIGIGKADLEAVASGIQALDRVLSRQLDEILHHPRFQAVESAWRGLEFLLRSAGPASERVRVDFLSCDAESLPGAIAAALGEAAEEPYAVTLLDHEFDHGGERLPTLGRLSSAAMAFRTLLVTGAGPELFGLNSLVHLTALPAFEELFAGEEYAALNAFKEAEASRHVALTANRILLRAPYSLEPEDGFKFVYRESVDPARSERYLWGWGGWIAGVRIMRSFADSGSCTALSGIKGEGLVDGLPARPVTMEEEDSTSAEVVLRERDAARFAHLGLSLLLGGEEPGSAYFPMLSVLHRSGTEPVNPQITLEYQLLVLGAARHLSQILEGLDEETGEEALVETLRQAFDAYLEPVGARAPAQAEIVTGEGDSRLLKLVLQPEGEILGKPVEVRLMIDVAE